MKKTWIGFCVAVFALVVIKLGVVQAVLGFQEGPPIDRLIQGLDRNGDARLSAQEINDATAVLESLDQNRDGQLTVDEIFPPIEGRQARRGPGSGRGPGGPAGGTIRTVAGPATRCDVFIRRPVSNLPPAIRKGTRRASK